MQLPLENLTWKYGEVMVVCEEFETALYDLTVWFREKKNGMLKRNDFHSLKGKVTRISFRLLITHAYGAKLQMMLEFAPVLYLNKRTVSFLFTLDVDSALCSFIIQTN